MAVKESAEWASLNERQKAHAEALAELALEYGKFDQSTGADGAHYAPAANNPFRAEGLVCQNCVFFDELSNGCQIVTGSIDPASICKLWVIPESSLSLPDGQITRAQLDNMTPAEIMQAKADGRLKALLGN
jgi:hypothetical protein